MEWVEPYDESTLNGEIIQLRVCRCSDLENCAICGFNILSETPPNSGIQNSRIQNSGIQNSRIQNSGIQNSRIQNSGIQSSGLWGWSNGGPPDEMFDGEPIGFNKRTRETSERRRSRSIDKYDTIGFYNRGRLIYQIKVREGGHPSIDNAEGWLTGIKLLYLGNTAEDAYQNFV